MAKRRNPLHNSALTNAAGLKRAAPIQYERISSPEGMVPASQFERWKQLLSTDAHEETARELERLKILVLSNNPILLLSALSAYQFHAPGTNPEYTTDDPLLQFHLEWLLAYCLRFDLADYTQPEYMEPILQPVDESLKRIAILSALERWQRANKNAGDESPTIDRWEQEIARFERLAVRNWGYADQMITLMGELNTRLDDWAARELGLLLSPLPALFMSIVKEAERRFNAQRRQAQSILRKSKSPVGFCRRWEKSTLPNSGRATKWEKRLGNGEKVQLAMVEDFIRSNEASFPGFFTFSSLEISSLSGGAYSESQVKGVMKSLSSEFGSLKDIPIDHLTLGNPTWTKPFVKIPPDAYFVPVPGMLLSHCMDICEDLVVGRDKEQWWRARGTFLEHRTHDLIQTAFPKAELFANTKWIDPLDMITIYENDLFAMLAEALIVVESKSHRVPAPVRRGAPSRMRESVREMLLQPSEQSHRFAQYMEDVRGVRPMIREDGSNFSINSSQIRSITRFNSVLDSFAVTAISTRALRDAGLIGEEDFDPAPSILLSDLQSILFLLPSQLQRLHYLSRRMALQSRADFQADEIDILALYVEDGFNWDGIDDLSDKVFVHGISTRIDPYLERHYAGGISGQRPLRSMSSLWLRMLNMLERDSFADWVSIGIALLDANREQQRVIAKKLDRAVRIRRQANELAGVQSFISEMGNSIAKSLFLGIVLSGGGDLSYDEQVQREIDRLQLQSSLDVAILIIDAKRGAGWPLGMRFQAGGNSVS